MVDECVGMIGCGSGMVGERMDDKGGGVRREGREMECDGCWGVIGVGVVGWCGLGV